MHKRLIMYVVNYVHDAIGRNGKAHAYKRWCCGHGRPIQVSYMDLSGHGASFQLQLLLPSALPHTLNLFYSCNGLFDPMGAEWSICMRSPAKMVCTLEF